MRLSALRDEPAGDTEWRFLLAGIDTIDLGFYVTWNHDWLGLLEALTTAKLDAEGSEGRPWCYRGGQPMLILPRGRRMYEFVLQHCSGQINMSKKQEAGAS